MSPLCFVLLASQWNAKIQFSVLSGKTSTENRAYKQDSQWIQKICADIDHASLKKKVHCLCANKTGFVNQILETFTRVSSYWL